MRSIINIIILALTFGSFYCEASCSLYTSVSKTLQFNTVTVQRDAPVGTVIATVTIPPTNIQTGGCSGYWAEYDAMLYLGGAQAGITDVYKTNLQGVGIQGDWDGVQWTYRNPATVDARSGTTGIYDGGYGQTFKLVKTDNIISGTLTNGLVATTYYDGNSSNPAIRINLVNSTVVQVACSITTPNLVFPIGDVLASTFGSSIGTTPVAAKNTQNLGLNCDAGANINVSLSGTQNPDVSTTSVLALTGQGSANVAKGVGVQILYNSSPLILNNRIVLKQSAGGQETFPLTARYYQTKTSVTTGMANASATLNLTYQ